MMSGWTRGDDRAAEHRAADHWAAEHWAACDCAGPWRGLVATREGCIAVAGIGRLGIGLTVPPGAGLSLASVEESLTLSELAEAGARTAHAAPVTGDAARLLASLSAMAATPRGGRGHLALALLVRVSVTNASGRPLAQPMLRLGWSVALPLQPPSLLDEAADPVIARVGDKRVAVAVCCASVSGPGTGGTARGTTAPAAAGASDLPVRNVAAHGRVVPLCSPDLSEEVLVLDPLAPGESRTLAWELAVTASVDARGGLPRAALAALTGGRRRTYHQLPRMGA